MPGLPRIFDRGRRRGGPAPTSPRGVVVASFGEPFTYAALREARERAGGLGVAVVTIAKVHGSSFGIPNPGLMPTKAERHAQLQLIDDAVELLEREGAEADGQVIVTRKSARAIARAAHRRGARIVVMDAPLSTNRFRAFVEGRPADDVRRQLRRSTVEVVEVARDSAGAVGSTEPLEQARADGVSTETARLRRIR